MATLGDINLLSVGNTIQLTGAIWEGEGRAYLCYLPDHDPETALHHLPMSTEEWVRFLRQTDFLETEVLAKAKDGSLTKAILRKSQRQIDQIIQWKVWKRDAFRCRYCANADVPLTVDHLVLWEEGGPTIEGNLVASCRKCDKSRGNLQYADWLRMPFYRRVSAELTEEARQANAALVGTLDAIPRRYHVHSR
jgi:5-methylcytosine-specific restriction endonuclease McrA